VERDGEPRLLLLGEGGLSGVMTIAPLSLQLVRPLQVDRRVLFVEPLRGIGRGAEPAVLPIRLVLL
jgi:hypothetical protein